MRISNFTKGQLSGMTTVWGVMLINARLYLLGILVIIVSIILMFIKRCIELNHEYTTITEIHNK